MMRVIQKPKHNLAKTIFTAFGISSTIWALWVWRALLAENDIAISAQRILSGESLKSAQLIALKLQIESLPSDRLSPSALNNIAVIRLRMVENDKKSSAGPPESAVAELNVALSSALSSDPNNSFLWLAGYWLQDSGARASVRGRRLLTMSYLMGPNEGWIAAKRNPLALEIFSSLSNELSDMATAEFVALVRSGFYSEGLNSLTIATEQVRQKMLSQLAWLSMIDRVGFAKEMRRRDLDWRVPGVVEPTARPF